MSQGRSRALFMRNFSAHLTNFSFVISGHFFVHYSITDILRCIIEHKKICETRGYQTNYGKNVPAQKVGGRFDVLHRYNSLRCLVIPIFLLIQFGFFTDYLITDKEQTKCWKFFYYCAVENFDHRGRAECAKYNTKQNKKFRRQRERSFQL